MSLSLLFSPERSALYPCLTMMSAVMAAPVVSAKAAAALVLAAVVSLILAVVAAAISLTVVLAITIALGIPITAAVSLAITPVDDAVIAETIIVGVRIIPADTIAVSVGAAIFKMTAYIVADSIDLSADAFEIAAGTIIVCVDIVPAASRTGGKYTCRFK